MPASTAVYTVEGELWNIFTYYALHADPTQPEMLKVPQFIRFCKDCQILSAKVTGTIVELEIAKVTRRTQGSATGYSTSANLRFTDFISLLEMLSTKVYVKCNKEVAMRRLLLENILVLSGRCVPPSHVQQMGMCDEDAVNTLQVIFAKSLQGIFNHYAARAEVRRNIILSGQFESRRSVESHLVPLSPTSARSVSTTAASADGTQAVTGPDTESVSVPPTRTQLMKTMKDKAKSFDGTIGYEEYSQFCQDYNLKSTNLLTALQVGDIFLTVVPYDPVSKGTKGMTFSTFCTGILLMALVSYRDLHTEITTVNKVKGFLLYMWKAISSQEKASKGLSASNALVGGGRAATSGNLHGSGQFCEQFLSIWQLEDFRDYVMSSSCTNEANEEEGLNMLKSIVYGGNMVVPAPETENAPNNASEDDPEEGEITKENEKELTVETEGEMTLAELDSEAGPPAEPIDLSSHELYQLFQLKPELAELVHLEILQQGQY